ncbi:hypothetical protein LguiA_036390 [Lonicera macranthoides]
MENRWGYVAKEDPELYHKRNMYSWRVVIRTSWTYLNLEEDFNIVRGRGTVGGSGGGGRGCRQ